jgi:hypothetical protein
MPQVELSLIINDTRDNTRYRLENAWIYWREGTATTILRAKRLGSVYRSAGGDSDSEESYSTPFSTESGKTVDVAYSLGARPEAFREFHKVTIALLTDSENWGLRPRYASSTGQTTTLRVLPLGTAEIPNILRRAVGVVTANVPRPAQSGAVAQSFLLHTFGLQSYNADRVSTAEAPSERRRRAAVVPHPTRADLIARSEELANQLGRLDDSPLRRLVWAVGHAAPGTETADPTFDMGPGANRDPALRVSLPNIVAVRDLVVMREENDPALATATIPPMIAELDREFQRLQQVMSTNHVTELVLYGCRLARGVDGSRIIRLISHILHTPTNSVRVGAFNRRVGNREIGERGSPVETGTMDNPGDEQRPGSWIQRSQVNLAEPEVWEEWEPPSPSFDPIP